MLASDFVTVNAVAEECRVLRGLRNRRGCAESEQVLADQFLDWRTSEWSGKSSLTTVDKALSLLDHFSNEQTEIGLSAFARASGFDKSAVLRMLSALTRAGFLEQDVQSRRYRLGYAFLRYARLREDAFPLTEIIRPSAQQLNDETRETVHVSLYAGGRLSTFLVIDSPRTTRAHVDSGMVLPFNATASGLCWLAFSEQDVAERHLSEDFAQYQRETLTDRSAIEANLSRFRELGYSLAERSFDEEVSSIAAPIFGGQGEVLGCISLACVASRMTPELITDYSQRLVVTAGKVTLALGASVPAFYSEGIAPDGNRKDSQNGQNTQKNQPQLKQRDWSEARGA